MYQLQFNPAHHTQKVKQIVHSVIADIERGVLKQGERLPSLCEISAEYEVSRDTVERAYRELKAQGYCFSVHGKGHFVQAEAQKKLRILLLFNKLSSYKKLIYYAFLETLGERAQVDLQIHHYSTARLKEIVEQNLGKYNYYVVMPHFRPDAGQPDCCDVLKQIPADQLVLLDRNVPDLRHDCLRVFQDFDRDIYTALGGLLDLLAKYERFVLVTPELPNGYLAEIAWGFRSFCLVHNLPFAIQAANQRETLVPGTAYVVMDTTDLAELLKEARQQNYILGEAIGVLAFNETALKELLDITVITTDFEAMGRTTAELLLDKKRGAIKNPFHTIRRTSL